MLSQAEDKPAKNKKTSWKGRYIYPEQTCLMKQNFVLRFLVICELCLSIQKQAIGGILISVTWWHVDFYGKLTAMDTR